MAIIINGTVGAGIFGLPSTVYRHVGTYSVLALIGCACLIGLVVLCLAELSSRFDKTGGPYLYALEAFGPSVGFQIGWLMWLQRLTAFAAICNLLIAYLGYLWPSSGSTLWRVIIIITVTISLAVANIRHIRETALVNDIFTVGKLIPILLFIAVGLFFIKTENYSFSPIPNRSDFSTSMLLFLFVFAGFDVAMVPAGEIRDPRKNLPFAMFTALGAVTFIYIMVQVVCIGTLPDLADSSRPLVDSANRIFGRAGGLLIVVGVLIAGLGSLATVVLTAPRILFALAENRQIPQVFSATHKKFHTPHIAVIVSSAVMLIVTLSGTFIYAVTINSLVRLLTYIVSCGALLVLRRRKAQVPLFRLPLGGVIATITLLICIWILFNSVGREVLHLILIVMAGLIIYLLNRRWQRVQKNREESSRSEVATKADQNQRARTV